MRIARAPTVPINDNPNKDLSAVPSKERADLVMTETTRSNLRAVAVGTRTGQATLLEGPPSAGKTSLVCYIAYRTGSPYRRIAFSYSTEVEDLLGRWVGGENRYDRKALKTMKAELRADIAKAYGIDPKLRGEKLIAALIEAQDVPVWMQKTTRVKNATGLASLRRRLVKA